VRPPRKSGVALITASIAAVFSKFAQPNTRHVTLPPRYATRTRNSGMVIFIQYFLGMTCMNLM
jgi:hypothetical protein